MSRLKIIRPIWYLVAALMVAAVSPAQIASGSQVSSGPAPAHAILFQEAAVITPQQGPPGSLYTILDTGRNDPFMLVERGDRETTVTDIFWVRVLGQTDSSHSPASGLASLIDADNLVRVFLFRNSTKDWLFYDPRPAFAAANTLDELLEGEIYWIKISRDQYTTLNDKSCNLTCTYPGTPSENCWNLVVW